MVFVCANYFIVAKIFMSNIRNIEIGTYYCKRMVKQPHLPCSKTVINVLKLL